MAKVTLVALAKISRMQPGDEFDVASNVALALVRLGKARYKDEPSADDATTEAKPKGKRVGGRSARRASTDRATEAGGGADDGETESAVGAITTGDFKPSATAGDDSTQNIA